MSGSRRLTALLLALLVALVAPAPPDRTRALAAEPPGSPGRSAAGEARAPVILIPGIAGTELYNRDEMVWLNTLNLVGRQIPGLGLLTMGWLMPLRLASDGAAPRDPSDSIRVGDLLRWGLTDAYSGMVAALAGEGYRFGHDLRLFPYDWRKDPTAAAAQLALLVERTRAETGAEKVVLVGHSLGGLIAREYIIRSGGTQVAGAIYLATPWLGAPLAYKALEYGWDLGLKLPGTSWSLMAPTEIRMLAQNFPSIYALVPGPRYWEEYPSGYLTRSGQALSYPETLARAIAPHNRRLASAQSGYLEGLLNGNGYGVQQFLLAGKGRRTVAAFTEWQGWFGATHKQEQMADGDDVIPLFSADLGESREPGRAARLIGPVAAVGYVSQEHTLMAQSPEVQRIVLNWLRQVERATSPRLR